MESKANHLIKDIIIRIMIAVIISFLTDKMFDLNLYLILIIAAVISIPVEFYFKSKI